MSDAVEVLPRGEQATGEAAVAVARAWGADRPESVVKAARSKGLGCKTVTYDDDCTMCVACGDVWGGLDLDDDDE